jgi:hypothetical protein
MNKVPNWTQVKALIVVVLLTFCILVLLIQWFVE